MDNECTDQYTFAYFKKACRGYFDDLGRLQRLQLRRSHLIHNAEGVHSVDLSKVMGADNHQPSSDPRLEIMHQKDLVEEEIQQVLDRIQYIITVLENIPDPGCRGLLWRAYVQRKPVNLMASHLSLSTDYVLKLLKEEVRASLKKMQNHDALQQRNAVVSGREKEKPEEISL
ncbi:MAG: hypothetical protein SOI44_00115 [Lactimicrobium sp.]|uniref:hypothetical protein n=1 Tax=Lactimicrobium sp. TaxID=2563780 RepID=UPI002F35CF3B